MKNRVVILAAALALCFLPSCMLVKDILFQEQPPGEVDVSLEPQIFAPTDTRFPEPREAYLNSDGVRLYARNTPPSPSPSPLPDLSPSPEASPEASPDTEPSPDAAESSLPPIPFVEFEEIETLALGEIITLLGLDAEGAYYVARTQRNVTGYLRASAAEDFDPETMYKQAYRPDSGVNQPTLALLESVTPGILTDPLLAYEGNYLSLLVSPNEKQHPAYQQQPWLLLDKTVALKLSAVRDSLEAQGLMLKAVGGYYPQTLQYKLYHAVNNETLVTNPAKTSRNAQGLAVDVILTDAQGTPLDFPTPVYTYTNAAMRPFAQATGAQRQNAVLLRQVMEEAGFTAVEENWWHFYDADSNYMISNMPYDTIILKAAPKDW